jgi:lactate dehydrogenase-like 2-hydroxyacid dehydrogenase
VDRANGAPSRGCRADARGERPLRAQAPNLKLAITAGIGSDHVVGDPNQGQKP